MNRQGGLVRRIKMHQEKDRKRKEDDVIPKGAVPSYLLDRQAVTAVARRLPMTVPSFVLYQGGCFACQSSFEHRQAEAERACWQMERAAPCCATDG